MDMLRRLIFLTVIVCAVTKLFAASSSISIDSLLRKHIVNYDSFLNTNQQKAYAITLRDTIALPTDTLRFYRLNIVSTDFAIVLVESQKHYPIILSAGYFGREIPSPQLGAGIEKIGMISDLTEIQLSRLFSKFVFHDNFVVFSLAERKIYYEGEETTENVFDPNEYNCSFKNLYSCSIQNNDKLTKINGKLDILVISLFDSRVNCQRKIVMGCRTGRVWLSKSKLQFKPLNNADEDLTTFIGYNDARVGRKVLWKW